jgi:sialidase-1
MLISKMPLFISGEGEYHTYRIPALAVTAKGTILAFAEARKFSRKDAGDIDIVLKRSFDDGETWSDMTVIADDGANTIGNPCPVVDMETGKICLLLCRNLEHGDEHAILAGKAPRDVFVMSSSDDGETWTEPLDITSSVKLPNWTWYATGPCHGIQLQSGRMLIPCNHADLDSVEQKSGPYRAHIIYSDDKGDTWQIGGMAEPQTNECVLAELESGAVYWNMRSYHGRNRRAVAWSVDEGMTWSPTTLDEQLVEPICQASALSVPATDKRGEIVLFSNPASLKRIRMTLKSSADGCRTWKEEIVLHEGPSAYSDLCRAADETIGCLYECGEDGPYERIDFARMDLAVTPRAAE